MQKREQPQDDWFEISHDMWLDPKFKPKKLKLLADAQLPKEVMKQIAERKIRIDLLNSAQERRAPDPNVLGRAHSKGFVLLTLDRDFWDDRKYPLHSIRGGIIYIAESPNRPAQILRAFELVYVCFASSYPLNWWKQTKVRATINEFELRMRTWAGKTVRYRIKVRGGQIVAKEIN